MERTGTRTPQVARDPADDGRVLAVVVPVRDGGTTFGRVLHALVRSDLPRNRWELIVVDDASADESASVASAHADVVIRLTGRPRGPAYARNRGFEASRAPYVAFVDADVLVHPDALSRMLGLLARSSALGAVVGTYTDARVRRGLLSDYRNLLRHVEHCINAGETDAFAAGLCIVRREAFARAGLFDEWRFPRPQAEALELGDRLRSIGYRIHREPDIAATHLKNWTIRDWIGVDLLDRGMALARLNQRPEFRARVDRLYLASPVDVMLAWTAVAAASMAIADTSMTAAGAAAAAVGAFIVHNHRLLLSFSRARGVLFAAAAIPLHVVTCAVYGVASLTGRALYHAVGDPQPDAATQAFAEVGLRIWPPVPSPVRRESLPSVHPNGKGAQLDG